MDIRPASKGRGATFLVAASDASASMIAQADYVCDGTADDVQIQAAITALPASGGKVMLSEGTFTVSAAINAVSNMTVEGSGVLTIITLANEVSSGLKMFELNNDDNVTFKDLTLDGNKANNSATNLSGMRVQNGSTGLRVLNVEFRNFTQHGMLLDSISESLLDNIYSHDNDTTGTRIEGGSNIAIGSFIAKDNGLQGLVITDTSADVYGSNLVAGVIHVQGNGEEGFVFESFDDSSVGAIVAVGNGSAGGNPGDGLALGGLRRCSFGSVTASSNASANNTGSGVRIARNEQSPQIACNQVTFGAITSYNNDESGIIITASTDISIASLDCNSNKKDGVTLNTGATRIALGAGVIRNNASLAPNTYSGVRATGAGANAVTELVINGLLIVGTGHQFAIDQNDDCDSWTIINCRVEDSISLAGSSNLVRTNVGYITENSGTATINSGATSVTITHGLAVTPTIDDISVIMAENPTNDPGNIWVDTITATQFTINCRADPGASNLDVAWRAVVL